MPSILVRKNHLADIHTRILAVNEPHRLGSVLRYEFYPLIRDDELLNDEYAHRLQFLRGLGESPGYQSCVARLHEKMQEIHRLLQPEKLDAKCRIKFFAREKQEYKAQSFAEMYSLLVEREPWIQLGDKILPLDSDDSLLSPWKYLVNQYAAMRQFLRMALCECKAGRPAANEIFFNHIHADVSELQEMIEEPWHRLHILDFEQTDFALRLHSLPPALANGDTGKIHRHADQVCRDLLLTLERQEATQRKPKGGRPALVDFKKGMFSFRGSEWKLVGKPDYALLCEAFYPRCPKTGKVPWVEVADRMREIDPAVGTLDHERIRQMMRSLNRWASHPRRSLGVLLRLEKESIVRMK